jgi:cytochrome P450
LGPHLCIGISFAMMQMTLTLATMLQRFRWALSPADKEIEPEPQIAIRPKGGLPMVATRRALA